MGYAFNPFTGNFDLTGNAVIPDPLTVNNLTVNTLLTANHIHGDIAGSLYFHVKNTSGTTLAKGTPVYAVGAVGDTTTLEIAAADSANADKTPAIGILRDELIQNASGHAVLFGELTGVNTGSYAINDELFLAAGGGLTNTRPTTGYIQSLAVVGRVHASTGSILVWTASRVLEAGGSNTQVQFNDGGNLAGDPSLTYNKTTNLLTIGSRLINSVANAASAPPASITGSWTVASGTGTTWKPALLIEPTGTTSTAWSTSGTGLGINAASGFTGRLLDLQLNGTSNFSVSSAGNVTAAGSISAIALTGTAASAFLPTTFSAGTITYGATTDLDMAALAGGYHTISLTGDLTFTTSNRASGRTVVIRLLCDSTQRTLTFPAGWVFVGTKPANIAASKTAVLSLTFFGTADTDCVAAYGVQA